MRCTATTVAQAAVLAVLVVVFVAKMHEQQGGAAGPAAGEAGAVFVDNGALVPDQEVCENGVCCRNRCRTTNECARTG